MSATTTIKLNTGGGATVGLDIGSTTAKIVLVQNGLITYECYERHYSLVREKALELVTRIEGLVGNAPFSLAISGSAGMGLALDAGLPFVQEVFSTGEVVRELEPDTDVVVELGGEDAKVIYFSGAMDERMNGSCAGGTGAFIDQMATLMNLTTQELDDLSLEHERIYPIASRCGVFAKSDIQPLLNQGARKADVAASIYQAVVDQTISGLAQGRRIDGKVMFLGGPLYFCQGLRARFRETLGLSEANAVFPEYGRFAVAMGAALYASHQKEKYGYAEITEKLAHSSAQKPTSGHLPPLFESEAEYAEFSARHARAAIPRADMSAYSGRAFLGIDCGSTTTKLALISENDELLYSSYGSNLGSPVEIIRQQLTHIYKLCGTRIKIAGSAVTGYGEELISAAFGVDAGLVETIAHFTAARHFRPDADFILDIGGQDIKCFKISNGAIDSIMLNEACSSGCGSFIETFAKSWGYDIETFSKLGLFAKAPVDLGSRCTVFMNSSVKQAQKDGAEAADISAGLSMSVVKNAIYKVIRARSAAELGKSIVVQGGTFLNDAVLRSFERELSANVVRPDIAGLMGAFGAALHIKSEAPEKSSLITPSALEDFTHTSSSTVCKGCGNHCRLTINNFGGGKKHVSGNKCEKGAGQKELSSELPNLYSFKRNALMALAPGDGNRGTIGLPLALGMYELAPLWHTIFTRLGFRVVLSGFSSRECYSRGQYSIPSDTACYPAKLMHGHIEALLDKGVDAIFYPCLTYNINEGDGQNHYNCPVVAYYSEVLSSNMESLSKTRFMFPYLNINNKKELSKELYKLLSQNFGGVPLRNIRHAVDEGFAAYKKWMADIKEAGAAALAYAKATGKRVMILAGRPYHIDPEICHGIDKLASSLGFVTVSEDSVFEFGENPEVNVLNQWTYHSRMYRAAEYAASHDNCELVQLVSFGCGLDAITTDEVRAVLESRGKLYTQIKIDEITNLGAVKIRLRSLLGAIAEREKANEKQNER
ncbi:MAG: acyl-CoA dehydratase activase-related protein [Oscillospiraceae bacterium]